MTETSKYAPKFQKFIKSIEKVGVKVRVEEHKLKNPKSVKYYADLYLVSGKLKGYHICSVIAMKNSEHLSVTDSLCKKLKIKNPTKMIT